MEPKTNSNPGRLEIRVKYSVLATFFYLLSFLSATSMAQEASPADDPLADVLAGHSYHGSAFNEGARQAARLFGGTGKVDFQITTRSDEARKFFNQGLGQLHGFWDLEAERSFRQVAMIDPDCAMAYWGAALATFEKPKRAAGFIDQAFERMESASEREQLYIKALHRYFHGDQEETEKTEDGKKDDSKKDADYEPIDKPTRKKHAARYLKDLEDIAIQYPDDIEAKALVVHRVWYNARAGWQIGSYVAAEALLKEIFRVNPLHPAHHYRIHLWDRRKPELALESAGMCGLSSPSIAHMWHMPGHIFSRLNRYDEAVYYQEASARTDHRHMITDHVIPDEIHNYAHNNEWLTRNYVFLGRANDALDLAMNLVELPRHPRFNGFDLDRSGSAVYGQRRVVQVLREFQMYDRLDEIIKRGCFSDLGVDQQIAAFRLQGCAAAIKGKTAEQESFTQQLTDLSKKANDNFEDAKEKVTSLKCQLEENDQPSDDEDAEPKEKTDRKKLDKDHEEAKKEKEKLEKRCKAAEQAIKAIEGYALVAKLDFIEAEKLLREAKGEDESWLAELRFLGGETQEGLDELRKQVEKRANESIPLARLAWCLFLSGDLEKARFRFEELRGVAIGADRSVEVFSRLESLIESCELDQDWVSEKGATQIKAHFRPSLESLGPVHWDAPLAPKWQVADSNNEVASSDSYAGENYLMIFYLGHGCLHCAEQLQAFGPRVKDFEDAGIRMIALSSDDNAGLSKSLDNYDGEMPIRLASNSALDIFKSFRAHDDFESQPLHGTFLIDKNGRIRWQDISYEPFMDHEFLLQESKRLMRFQD